MQTNPTSRDIGTDARFNLARMVIVYAGQHYGSPHRVIAQDGNVLTCEHWSGDVVNVHSCDTESLPDSDRDGAAEAPPPSSFTEAPAPGVSAISPAGTDALTPRMAPERRDGFPPDNFPSADPVHWTSDREAAPALAERDSAPVGSPIPHHQTKAAIAARASDWAEAQTRANLCADFAALLGQGMSGNQAARLLGKAASWFSTMLPQWQRGGVAAVVPRRRETGAKPSPESILLTEGDVARIRFILLRSNRSKNAGSRNFAILKYAQTPDCPAALRDVIQRRRQAGLPLLPPSALSRIQVTPVTFAQHRGPTDANLDFFQCPGSAMWISDEATGARRFIRAGEVVEADDATINFCCTVPWEMGGCPCSERWGVKLARFQLLLAIDVGSRRILGYTYVIRPRSSYRGEDVVTLQNSVARAHGEPDFWRFERGVWESNAVQRRVKFTGAKLWTVYSPHAKPFVEGVFNKLWTILSLEAGQVGRFRGEMESNNELLTACQSGARDPRPHFSSLKQTLSALDAAIQWHNTGPIHSPHYGTWIPDNRWEIHQAARPNRKLAAETEWLAAPLIRDWTVRGNIVGGVVRLFDGCSAPFQFSADWLPNFDGAKVRAHFDPALPACAAMLCLAAPFRGRATGEVLGSAVLVDECASYARLVLEWGTDPRDAGKKSKATAHAALRREVRAIGTDGQVTASTTEIRDGLGRAAILSTGMGGTGNLPVVAGDPPDSTLNLPSAPTVAPGPRANHECATQSESDRMSVELRSLAPERSGANRGRGGNLDPDELRRLAEAEQWAREHALEFLT